MKTMKYFNYPSNLKEHIEKKHLSAYFYDKEDMEKALAYDGHMCGSRGYFLYRKDGYSGADCAYVSCPDCPFNVENKALLKSMLPQLNEASSEAEETPETQIKMKREQDLNNAETQALNIPVVMPSFLTHPYAQVVCTNKGELNYVLEWAKKNGKEVSEHYYKVEKFPYHLFLAGKIVGWTDSTNRVGDKFSFREFVDGVNWA